MYQFSRAIYRELVDEVGPGTNGRCIARQRLLAECEAAMERLATDRHYFAKPVRTLFNDVRCLFPMGSQMHVYRVIEHQVTLAAEYVDSQAREGVTFDGSPLCCHATTRKGTSCQRVPLPASKYCPSHKHLDELGVVAAGRSERSRPTSAMAEALAPAMILGVDVGGTFTDAVLLDRRGVVTGKAPTTPDDQSEGVHGRGRAGAGRRRAPAGDVERLVHGMTVGTNALLEGTHGAHRAGGHRGLHRPRGARPPGAARALPPVRRAARAARGRELRVAAPERCGPDGVLRRARRGRAARAPCRARGRRTSRPSPSACCGAFATPGTSGGVAELVARGAAGRPRVDLARDRRGVPRVRALRHHHASTPRSRRCCAATCARLTERTGDAGLPDPEIMLSSGGVADAATAAAHGSWTVLSGPAGGAVAAARAAPRGRVAGTPSAWTWAAPRATCRWCWTAAWP